MSSTLHSHSTSTQSIYFHYWIIVPRLHLNRFISNPLSQHPASSEPTSISSLISSTFFLTRLSSKVSTFICLIIQSKMTNMHSQYNTLKVTRASLTIYMLGTKITQSDNINSFPSDMCGDGSWHLHMKLPKSTINYSLQLLLAQGKWLNNVMWYRLINATHKPRAFNTLVADTTIVPPSTSNTSKNHNIYNSNESEIRTLEQLLWKL
jgi:hypothetical protein